MKPKISCPKCGAATRVVAWRVAGYHLRRQRVCTRCGHQQTMRE